jgi:uncharacterized protein Smg (DUF494 family)
MGALRWGLQPLRAALLEAVIGAPRSLPSPRDLDLEAAWRRYHEAAPAHVRVGFDVATLALGVIAPRLMGYGEGLVALDDAQREQVLRRVAVMPLGEDLVQVAKVVACLVYFADPSVEDAARRL